MALTYTYARLNGSGNSDSSTYLCFIFQQSINTGEVPLDWKHANFIEMLKKGSRSGDANYKPVSLTSVPFKLLEHIIYHSIMINLNSFDILLDAQHGFRQYRRASSLVSKW